MTSPLHLRATKASGCIQSVHPDGVKDRCPNWAYVGFAVHILAAGEMLSQSTDEREHMLVVITGGMSLTVNGQPLGVFHRDNLFARQKAEGAYVPAQARWTLTATTDLEVAICSAPGAPVTPDEPDNPDAPGRPARAFHASGDVMEERGKGANTRFVNAIAMEDTDIADSLLVTEVWTPQGNWSSYPPHKHDQDMFPAETYLEETYYHRLNPAQGYGYQRVYNDDLTLDENIAFHDRDVVLVPEGYHPCGAPYGYDLYYLNVMAGPMRKWRFTNDPKHEWLFVRDGGVKPS